jgi:cysteine desulfuration protein SufE
MASIQDIQNKIIEEFDFFDDWDDKYGFIIDMGKSLKTLDSEFKTEENIIKGCQSQVWLRAFLNEEKIIFEAESDAIIVKGIVAMLLRVFSDQTPDDIVNADIFFMERIGMAKHLSPTRANGLVAMVKQIKLYALAFKTKMSLN